MPVVSLVFADTFWYRAPSTVESRLIGWASSCAKTPALVNVAFGICGTLLVRVIVGPNPVMTVLLESVFSERSRNASAPYVKIVV